VHRIVFSIFGLIITHTGIPATAAVLPEYKRIAGGRISYDLDHTTSIAGVVTLSCPENSRQLSRRTMPDNYYAVGRSFDKQFA